MFVCVYRTAAFSLTVSASSFFTDMSAMSAKDAKPDEERYLNILATLVETACAQQLHNIAYNVVTLDAAQLPRSFEGLMRLYVTGLASQPGHVRQAHDKRFRLVCRIVEWVTERFTLKTAAMEVYRGKLRAVRAAVVPASLHPKCVGTHQVIHH